MTESLTVNQEKEHDQKTKILKEIMQKLYEKVKKIKNIVKHNDNKISDKNTLMHNLITVYDYLSINCDNVINDCTENNDDWTANNDDCTTNIDDCTTNIDDCTTNDDLFDDICFEYEFNSTDDHKETVKLFMDASLEKLNTCPFNIASVNNITDTLKS